MKKLFPLLALCSGLLQAGLLSAGTININMTDPSGDFRLRSAESAGVVPQPNWNNIPYSPNQNGSTTTNSVIVDGDGEATPLRLTYRAWDGRTSGSVVGSDPNARMMKGKGPSPFNSSSDPHTYAAIELTGCNASAGAAYDVYVYINEGIGFTTGSYGTMYLSGAGTFGSGGPPSGASVVARSGYRTLNSSFTGTAGVPVYDARRGFIRSDGGTAGNYVLFENITLDTLTITPWMANDRSNFHGVGMTGIQLVPVGGEICGNNADDDGDGAVDCEDSDCPACPEICDNGEDDDGDGDTDCDDSDCSEVESCQVESFVRGDANGDAEVNISDASFTLRYLFQGGSVPTCLLAVDANGDSQVDISDAAFTLSFLFLGARRPPEPYPGCGTAPGEERLSCEASPAGCQ